MALAHSRGASLDAAGDAAFRSGLCLWGKGCGSAGVSWVQGGGRESVCPWTPLTSQLSSSVASDHA